MNKTFQFVRHSLVELTRWFFSVIIPVKKGKIILQSYPDYADNSRAFSDYLIANTNYHLYWSVSNASTYSNTERITFIEKDGGGSLIEKIKFIYHTVSSQYLFSTHAAFFYANGRKQSYICLWHGAPLKKIAVLQNPANKNYLSNTTGLLCSSNYYVPIMAKCFGWDKERIIPIGIPRNDWLFKETKALEKLCITKDEQQKIIVYLPTFRKTSITSACDSNQDVYKIGKIDFSSDDTLRQLNEYLTSIRVKLIVKPHPADPNQQEKIGYSNIIVLPHKRLVEQDVQLNQVLHYADALITDFSGVYIDYMVLDRPIGFVLSDLSEYTSNRGFLFDNPLEYMPGMPIYNETQFMQFCKDVSENIDEYKTERERMRHIYNDYHDAYNCKRLAQYLGMQICD